MHFILCVKPTLETYGIEVGSADVRTWLRCRGASVITEDLAAEDALHFDSVLEDPIGLQSFTMHLLREFSVSHWCYYIMGI